MIIDGTFKGHVRDKIVDKWMELECVPTGRVELQSFIVRTFGAEGRYWINQVFEERDLYSIVDTIYSRLDS